MIILYLLCIFPVYAATLNGILVSLQDTDYTNTLLDLRNLQSMKRELRHPSKNGTFAFYNLEQGEYKLTLDSDTLDLPFNYIINVTSDIEVYRLPEELPLDYKGTLSTKVESNPLKIAEFVRPKLVADRETFSIFKFCTQTSVWLSVGSLLLVTYLPSLLDNLDPELLEEIKKNQIGANSKQTDFNIAKTIADSRVKK